MEISSQGDFVVLEVDDQKALVVGLKSKETMEVLTGQIRLALGGILVSVDKLFLPVCWSYLSVICCRRGLIS